MKHKCKNCGSAVEKPGILCEKCKQDAYLLDYGVWLSDPYDDRKPKPEPKRK